MESRDIQSSGAGKKTPVAQAMLNRYRTEMKADSGKRRPVPVLNRHLSNTVQAFSD